MPTLKTLAKSYAGELETAIRADLQRGGLDRLRSEHSSTYRTLKSIARRTNNLVQEDTGSGLSKANVRILYGHIAEALDARPATVGYLIKAASADDFATFADLVDQLFESNDESD